MRSLSGSTESVTPIAFRNFMKTIQKVCSEQPHINISFFERVRLDILSFGTDNFTN